MYIIYNIKSERGSDAKQDIYPDSNKEEDKDDYPYRNNDEEKDNSDEDD